MAESPISIRLDEGLLARLDALAEELTKRAAGARVGRSSVMRLALERGLASLEGELGLARKPRKRR